MLQAQRSARLAKARQEAASKSPLGALGKRLRAAQRAKQDAEDEYATAEKGATAVVKAMEKCAFYLVHVQLDLWRSCVSCCAGQVARL